MLFGCQFVCLFHYSSLNSYDSPQHKTFVYSTEFLQYSLVANIYVEVHDFVLQISFCDRCQRYEKLKTPASDLKTIKVMEALELLGMDLLVS